ncbi:hypothetical protein JCM19000A_31000 [Silvimonas sp. JCM 19000]
MKLAIIVSTYNRIDALNAVLSALAQQTGVSAGDWEVLVADDGSGPATRQCIESWQQRFPCRLDHVWHADTGFRLAAIRNLSVGRTRADYLVFLDGDCVPFPDFVAQHRALAEHGWFVAGNRVLLSERFTPELLASAEPAAPIHWNALQWLAARYGGKANRGWPWLRLGLRQMRKRRPTRWQVLKGCNIGVWRSDFLAVDGFDEAFSGWGHEDSDFAIRLIRAGLKLKDGRFAVPVLHLWHKENDRSQQPENQRRLQATLNGNHTRAERGLSQYASANTRNQATDIQGAGGST